MELVNITSTVVGKIADSGVHRGICCLFNPHTTAGLTINEGADPAVQDDIIEGLREIVPLSHPFSAHGGQLAVPYYGLSDGFFPDDIY